MKGTWVLGKAKGIKIQVHWTFSLLLLWVVLSNLREGGDARSALFTIALVLVLFVCVILHELGHALMARRFGIGTRSITLLPIGGIASLEKMPEKPKEELAVALAGPAVNAIIALGLLLVIPLGKYAEFTEAQWEAFITSPPLEAFPVYLLMANILLVVFNMIPAFPMDGGRVLRALLGFFMNRAQATEIAARLGQGVSLAFLLLGLFYNPFLVIIAIFVFFGAYVENKMVQQDSKLKGHLVHEALLTDITVLPPDAPLQRAIDAILKGTEKDFVVAVEGTVVGILNYKDILGQAAHPHRTVREVMHKEIKPVEADAGLSETLSWMSQAGQRFLPVVREGRLHGAISTENISEFILLQSALGSSGR